MQPSPQSNSRAFLSLPKETPYSSTVPPHSCCPPATTNLFLSLWICLFWTLPINGTFSMWSFVSGFFHLAYFQGSNILQQISVLRCFCVWPNNFPLYGCATLCSSIHKWWTLGCCEHSWAGFCVDMFSFLLGVEPLGHMVTLCLTFWGTSELFSNLIFWP